jgi:hypothetical protein
MKTQIPIYRAKKLDSDEYVEGYYFYENIDVVKHEFKDECREAENHYIGFGNGYADLIDPSTLAIHFPDILDSEGTKIFASLSEDGKGGDIIEYAGQRLGTCIYSNSEFKIEKLPMRTIIELSKETKVTGIQQ